METVAEAQINNLRNQLGVWFRPDKGGRAPIVDEMVNLMRFRTAARALLAEIDSILGDAPTEDYAAAEALLKAPKSKDPFDLIDDPREHPEDFDRIHNDDGTVTSRPKRAVDEIE